MTKLLVLLALVLTIFLAEGRHVHPRSVVRMEEEGNKSGDIMEIDGIPTALFRNLSPNRFVPFNNEEFFKRMEPCEEGLKRDILGVCREVWD